MWLYFLAWFGMMALAVVNGVVRESFYRGAVGELRAHQISTLTLLVLIFAYVWIITGWWPAVSGEQAWWIGLMWMLMTVTFEFGMGRFISGKPWKELLLDYNVLRGRVWILIPLGTLVIPWLVYVIK
jgi:hypothetical protein